ncbi:MAG TPA: hypothetical protein VHD33_03315, partial [Legionellaceae bacterium]|nr:hypothetical protein [Legionellaceae bacterium]
HFWWARFALPTLHGYTISVLLCSVGWCKVAQRRAHHIFLAHFWRARFALPTHGYTISVLLCSVGWCKVA